MGGVKVYLAVILSQAIYAGMVLLTKAIFNGGMNCYIFTFYRQLVGTVVLVPLALIFKRVTIPINASNVAIAYTTATLGAAILNCLPVATFCLALLLRMENVTLKTTAGIVKIAGLVACVGGVVTLTFYKGPHLNPFLHHHPVEYHHPQQAHQPHISSNKRWLIGSNLEKLSRRAKVDKPTVPYKFWSVFCICYCFRENPSEWKLGWNIELLTIIYSGILITSLSYNIQAWVVQIKGPVFIAMSQPLTLIITMIGSVLLLGEAINLGSVLGGILLVVSLYAVLWGKSKDQTLQNQSNSDNKAEADILALEEAEVKKNHYEDEIRV
ncbi:hypothetical protein CsatB_023579 [Cannabis sativa]